MKYLKQTNSYSCGAIALINLFKFMGVRKYSKKSVPFLNKQIKTIPSEGTYDINVLKFLRKKGIKARSINSISVRSLKYLLRNNYYIIATIETPHCNHYTTIVDSDVLGITFSNNFSWKDMPKKNPSIKKLKSKVYYKYSTIRKICTTKSFDLSVILIKKY